MSEDLDQPTTPNPEGNESGKSDEPDKSGEMPESVREPTPEDDQYRIILTIVKETHYHFCPAQQIVPEPAKLPVKKSWRQSEVYLNCKEVADLVKKFWGMWGTVIWIAVVHFFPEWIPEWLKQLMHLHN